MAAFGAWVMHDIAPLGILALGFVLGIFFDRLVLWPLAVLLARLFDGRIRTR